MSATQERHEDVIAEISQTSDLDRKTISKFVHSIFDKIEEHFPFRQCNDCDSIFSVDDVCPDCGSTDISLSFRDHQKEIIIDAAVALWVEGYDNVAIEGPTGIGKSAINYVLGMIADNGFYTTPQKSLRNQLEDDPALQEGMQALRGRADYTCKASGKNCQECPINQSNDQSCVQQGGCTYWDEKEKTMLSPLAATTFAYLIVDNHLPAFTENGERLSFMDRELGIVDECHTLEGQVASMFAGFKISPWAVPPEVFGDLDETLEAMERRGNEPEEYKDVKKHTDMVFERAERFVAEHDGEDGFEQAVDDCESFMQKYNYFLEEISEDRHWVVDTDTVSHPTHGGDVLSLQMKPVRVDRFLKSFVWSRAEKWVLSTATMPYRGNPEKWFDRLGLEGDTKVIKCPMPFPVERRPIHLEHSIDSFSKGGDEDNWEEILAEIQNIARKHEGEKGLIHSASYDRAKQLVEDLPMGLAMHDEQGVDSDKMIEKWQKSNAQILISPAMMEGVDLKYDICRWQVMMKVPYPNGYADNRISFLLDQGEWDWYYQETGLQLWQSYGRAMRAADDRQDYYVLDESFMDVMNRVNCPKWVTDAIGK